MTNDNQKDPLSYWQSRALDAERERDELAAHVERLREALWQAADRFETEFSDLAGEADCRLTCNETPTQSLREVRHQERERAALICDEEADEWDSDRLVTHKNYAAYCARRIRSGEL